jgi:hypothetical protein
MTRTTNAIPSSGIDPAEHQRIVDYINKKNDPRIVRKTIDDGEDEIVVKQARAALRVGRGVR